MAYIEGFVIPVPTDNKPAYLDMAGKAAKGFMRHGALRLVEAWGDDVPHGKLTDFHRAVAAEEGETVVFAWVVWPSREARSEGMAALRADPEFQPGPDMPFDTKRMIFGGFEIILDTSEGERE
jgi:uncharacterized protein YbaA (DUF1428 family)